MVLKCWREHKRKYKMRKKKDRRPWYSNECRKTKGVLNRAEKEFKKDPFNRNKKELLLSAREKFKTICRKFRKYV